MKVDEEIVTLFEVSWEVCNKVGGIYSVVSSKALQAIDEFGDNFYLLGPDLKNNSEFKETDERCWDPIRNSLNSRGINFRLGRWDIPGNPKVILIDFVNRHNSNQILYELWNLYRIDSLSGSWDYIEPIMFSYTCGEAIAAIHKDNIFPINQKSVAQFHEWMCGAGLLAVKKLAPEIATVFTTHATMLGRALSGSGADIYKQMRKINPSNEAAAHNITAKCSIEAISARESDCFTTVSSITGEEAEAFLGRKADFITTNGLDMRVVPDYSVDRTKPLEFRAKLLRKLKPLLRKNLPKNTRIFVISGRYEFRNKGIDIFLEALADLAKDLKGSNNHVLALFFVMGGHTGINEKAISNDPNDNDNGLPFLSSHNVWNQAHDPIINNCRRLQLNNLADDNVNVVFVPAMLDGNDGFIDMPYYDILAACDLGVFPSWYEPWGYTPHESAAFAVPTVTTDLSGFGMWMRELPDYDQSGLGVSVISRRNNSYQSAVDGLRSSLFHYATCSQEELDKNRVAARKISLHTSWENFFPKYIKAYELALSKTVEREDPSEDLIRIFSAKSSSTPFLRTITAIAELPENLIRLRELSRNLWWCWNSEAKRLFYALNPSSWKSSGHNPVIVIENAVPSRLNYLSQNEEYLSVYKSTMENFDKYLAEGQKSFDECLNPEKPIAYFSTEYGLHESLPIYSGGLGVLSGDHLKSASDLRIPLVAVGLLYKNGYFTQFIDSDGLQVALYPENVFCNLPLEKVIDPRTNEPMEIELDLPGRTLFANVWLVHVGRVSLYLMDTDNPKNTNDDQKITARLYEADRDYRLRQEILLGMGGVRMLRKLNFTVSVYHMNEGHSAFMVIERIRSYMFEKGLNFQEAFERVRSNTIFTTHTPVDAGNERFSVDLMQKYFSGYAKAIGLSWHDFLRLGCIDGNSQNNNFEMTVLALKSSFKANGVSKLHGIVSQHMWRDLWKGVHIHEIPIGHVTNGIHVASYVGDQVHALLTKYLGDDWLFANPDSSIWQNVAQIPDEEFWNARLQQKEELLELLRNNVAESMQKFKIKANLRKELLSRIHPKTLIIGFARRFAPYKRATLLFADPDRLERLLDQMNRPVIFVFSGKSHPADGAGIQLIREVIKLSQQPRFVGRIFFIENYSLAISRILSQGCDVWLNTPRRPYEASGTSGQKVPVNGGINLSVSDGWWCEGYNRENGWTIGPVVTTQMPSDEQNDYADADSLYKLLEESVLPLYFNLGDDEMPSKWISMSKRSLQSLTAMYSSHRMVLDYTNKCYHPAAIRNKLTHDDDYKLAKHVAAWKQTIPVRFGTVRIISIQTTGLDDNYITYGETLHLEVTINIGELTPSEVLVQLVIGLSDENQNFFDSPETIELTGNFIGESTYSYKGSYLIGSNGHYACGVRIMPITEGLASPLDSNLVLWG